MKRGTRPYARFYYDDFIREFPLEWKGRTHRYDFAFPTRRVILETNGRRWHDDAVSGR